MKTPKLTLYLLAAAIVAAAAMLFVAGWNHSAEENTVSAAAAQFLLLDRDGRVAVCDAGTRSTRTFTAIEVATLPAADRESLRLGIPAGDEEALSRLLEDLGC